MYTSLRSVLVYFLLCILVFPDTKASNFFSFAGMCTARTLGDISLFPMAFGLPPVRCLNNLLFEKLGSQEQEKSKKNVDSAEKRRIRSQKISSEKNGELAENQCISIGELPDILHASLASIHKDSHAPVYVNLNLNNQQVAAHASTKKAATGPLDQEAPKPFLTDPDRPSLKKTILQSLQSVKTWIQNNKIKCCLFGAGGIATSIQGLLWYLSTYLNRSDCWSLWLSHTTLAHLYQQNQNDLIKELIKNLQIHDPLASSSTLIKLFLKQGEDELQALNTYSTLVSLAKKWPLKYFLFTQASLTESIPTRISRLSYIKNVAIAWLNFQENHYSSPQSKESAT